MQLLKAAATLYLIFGIPAVLVAQPSTGAPVSMKSIDEYLLFYPSKYPEGEWTPTDLTYQDVYFESLDHTKLHGWYCPSPNPRGVVLMAHGNAGHVAMRADWLRYLQKEMRLSLFMFDYRGYGRSEGKPTVNGVIDDCFAARAKLRELANVKDSDMILMGESLGGAMVIRLAANSPPKALVVQSTFPTLRDVAAVHFPRLAWLVPKDKLDSMKQIANYRGPLLLSHGDQDRTIPIELGRKLFDASNEPKQFLSVPGADHNNWLTTDYLRQLDQFITPVSP